MLKILIPTCREKSEIQPLIDEICENTRTLAEVFASCIKDSASVNRNVCLDRLEIGERAIMLDDDIEGFYPGWEDDLLCGLDVATNVVMVSARLLNPDGKFGPTCSMCYDAEPEEIILHPRRPHCIMPTAAIAFFYRGHRFPAGLMKGSGWEDNWWAAEYIAADPDAQFVQSNRAKLIHRNEQKSQKGEIWEHNRRVFFERWPGGIPWKKE